MFLIVLGSARPNPLLVPGNLKQLRFPVWDSTECQIFVDPGRYRVTSTPVQVEMFHLAVPDEPLLRLDIRGRAAYFKKPLLFGKPMFYHLGEREVAASTHVRLLRNIGIPLEENEQALPEYFLYRYVTPPATLFRGILRLPSGSGLPIRTEQGRIRAGHLTWTDVFKPSSERYHLDDAARTIAEDLDHRIKILKPDASSVGCLLSGGVDSSILFRLAAEHLGLRESHSTGYPFEDERYNDERAYAVTASEAMGSKHRYHSFTTADYLHGLLSAVNHAEVPVVHLQSVLLELLFQRGLPNHIRTVLCGQGADALFGLSMMYNYNKYKHLLKWPFAPLLGVAAKTVGRLQLGKADYRFPFARLHAYSQRSWDTHFEKTNHALWIMGEFGDRVWVKQRFGVDDQALLQGRLAAVTPFKVENVLDALSILDFLSDVSLTQDVWGKLADAAHRFVYYPFNSPALVRASFLTPWPAKVVEPKLLIRKVGERIDVPQFILTRPKRGFGIKPERWAGHGGVLEPLQDVAAPVVGAQLLRDLQDTDEKRSTTYWCLINYAIWKRLLIKGESIQTLQSELDEAIGADRISVPGARHA